VLGYSRDFLRGRNAISENRKSEMIGYFSSIKEDWALEVVEWLKED